MMRTQPHADPAGRFVHELVLQACQKYSSKTALVDTSCGRNISYGEYGELVESLAKGFISAGVKPGDVIAIFLFNSWEFCVAYHAATLAGAIPTPLNPTYREREVRYQLENSDACLLLSDGPNLEGINLAGLPSLRAVYTTRHSAPGTLPFYDLLKATGSQIPEPAAPSAEALAALPYSSGTTGLPKGVMLTHHNLVANVFQILGPNAYELHEHDILLCFLPLYHIYGLNVGLNPVLMRGATLVLMPRFHVKQFMSIVCSEQATITLVVPPALQA